MKKVLAFLLVFAAGLAVLRLVQGPSPASARGDGDLPPWVPPPGTDAPGLTPGGELVVRQLLPGDRDDPGRRPVRLVLRAEDSGPGAEPDALVFRGVELRYLDPQTESVRLVLDAAVAHARRAPAQSELDLQIAPQVELEDVAVTLLEGAPILPLSMRVPRVVLDLEARTLTSDAAVEVEGGDAPPDDPRGEDLGSELTGGGEGLFVDLDEVAPLLRLERDGALRLSGLRPGAALRSTEALVVEADPDRPDDGVRITAQGGAHLEPGGTEAEGPPALDARTIVLRGTRGGPDGLVIRSIEADGEVRYAHAGHRLEGGHVVVVIGEDGGPRSALLSQSPRATLSLDQGLPGFALPAPPAGAPRIATITSQGDLELIWEDERVRVLADGPARVEGAGTTLDSEGPITGDLGRDGRRATFAGAGGVRLARESAVLATERLDVSLERLDDGRTRVHAAAAGRPLITGKSADGRDYVLSAEGALEFEQVGDRWTVPRAERVVLTVLGDDGFRARADRLVSFDPEAVALEASGRVQVESAQGTAAGETLTVTGPEAFALSGGPDAKAWFENAEGRAEAATVTGVGGVVVLEGEVAGRFAPSVRAGERYDLECRRLELERALEDLADGATARRFRAEALDVTKASLLSPTDEIAVACAELDADFREVLEADGTARERASRLDARGVGSAEVERAPSGLHVRLACATLEAWRTELAPTGGGAPLSDGLATASGGVTFDGTAREVPFHGVADRVTVDERGEMIAHALPGERVYLDGELPSNRRPFELEADWVRASAEELEAQRPQILVRRMQGGADGPEIDVHARADRMRSTETWIEFEGAVHVEGVTEQNVPWRVDAGRVRFDGKIADPASAEPSEVSEMRASQGVVLTLPQSSLRAVGETLTAERLSGLMRLEGVPARIESATLVHEAEWIELDVNLGSIVGTGRGRVRPPDRDESAQDDRAPDAEGWTVDYLSSSTLVEPDHFVYVLQEPRIVYEGPELQVFLPVLPTNKVEVSASWAVFWVNRKELDALSDELDADAEEAPPAEAQPAPEPEAEPQDQPEGFFGRIREFGVLSEVYLEGPVELVIQGQPNATASAIYLDVVSGNGWLADATFTITGDTVGRDFAKVKISADWLRQSNDASFYADEARISLCEFEEPHMEITTGDLRIAPNASDPRHYDIRVKDNRIRMFNLFTLPLPSIDFSTNERGNPILASLKLGSSARFGSFVSAGFARPAEGAANFFRRLLGRPQDRGEDAPSTPGADAEVDAQYHVDASWLGSRGVLLDFGFEVESEEQFRWLTELGGVPDSDKDKGYVRVPEDDRDTLRLWLRSTGRYWFDDRTWLDVVGTYQSDAGVQSEFFESDFTRYELQESYLRVRTAQGSNYASAAVTGRFDDFFSSVDEQPSLSAWHGRGEVLGLGRTSIVYAAEAQAAYLARRESDGGYASPFGLPPAFADGLGEREVARFDTTHRLEAPTPLGAGVRATPFLVGRFTAWSEDELEEDEPLRGFGQAGVRVALPLWKEAAGGGVHQLVPYAEAREDVLLEEEGGVPVGFDEVEQPLEGRFVDVGVRGRIRAQGAMPLLDLDLRATQVSEVPDAAFDGWTEFGVFGRLSAEAFEMPVQITHDARYDFEEGDTLYSRFAVGVRPRDDLAFEAAHYRGLDLDREPLFEAATITGVYTWTPKWEFEGRQTFSLLEDGERLGSGVILRRYGHDLVFEIEASYRQGEGSSVGISVRPLFNYDRPDVGELSF